MLGASLCTPTSRALSYLPYQAQNWPPDSDHPLPEATCWCPPPAGQGGSRQRTRTKKASETTPCTWMWERTRGRICGAPGVSVSRSQAWIQ